jgi:DnaD/phage-associated family protein
MKLFSGFPSGKIKVTPLPNLFFSELCPAIDDLAELKVTLHIFWLLAHRKGNAATNVRASELRADRTLMQSLATDGAPDDALMRALAKATARGTLLHLSLDGDDAYFLNTEAGRRAHEQMLRAGEKLPRDAATREPASVNERPNIFALYEQNIGLLTPMIAEELKEAEGEYPAEWIADAFKEAVARNARNWKYIRAILERWKAEGRKGASKKDKRWWDGGQDKFVRR